MTSPPMSAETISEAGEAHEKRIAEILALQDGWNSYRAPPIDPACVERARPFLKALDELGMSPWLAPMTDGGVGIERGGIDDYRLEFTPDGKASFYCDRLTDFSMMALLLELARHVPPVKSSSVIASLTARVAVAPEVRTGEKAFAIRLANTVLDRPSHDPDDDLAVLARQFLRAIEPRPADSAVEVREMPCPDPSDVDRFLAWQAASEQYVNGTMPWHYAFAGALLAIRSYRPAAIARSVGPDLRGLLRESALHMEFTAKMLDRFRESDMNHECAHRIFVDGEYATWERARHLAAKIARALGEAR